MRLPSKCGHHRLRQFWPRRCECSYARDMHDGSLWARGQIRLNTGQGGLLSDSIQACQQTSSSSWGADCRCCRLAAACHQKSQSGAKRSCITTSVYKPCRRFQAVLSIANSPSVKAVGYGSGLGHHVAGLDFCFLLLLCMPQSARIIIPTPTLARSFTL